MSKPLVSILIPFKNTARFLSECLVSIKNQSYETWEVIAIDDHSTDNSHAVVSSFAAKDGRIKTYPNKGNGIIAALQMAYANCHGNLITRMDSDDIMVTHKIETLVKLLSVAGTGHAAIGQVKYFSEKGISNGYARYEKWLNELTASGTNYSEIYKECVIPSPCWMVYRSDFEYCDAFNPDRYPEDYDLTFRFYEGGLKCIPCNEVLHQWRDYDTRTSRTSEHYAQNYFLDIKLHYFLKLSHDSKRPLVVWGAGNKGKTIAKNLKEHQIPFFWLCDNPNKIGKKIYDVPLFHYSKLQDFKTAQSIITVANAEAQGFIKAYLEGLQHKPMLDFFFFC